MRSALVHENIVQFYGIAQSDRSELFLILELMERGDLRSVLDTKGENLQWGMRVKLALDAARGMRYLHRRKGTPARSEVTAAKSCN